MQKPESSPNRTLPILSTATAFGLPILIVFVQKYYFAPTPLAVAAHPAVLIAEVLGRSLPALVIGLLLMRLLGAWPWNRSLTSTAFLAATPTALLVVIAQSGERHFAETERLWMECASVRVALPLGAIGDIYDRPTHRYAVALRGDDAFSVTCLPLPEPEVHTFLENYVSRLASMQANITLSTFERTVRFGNPAIEAQGTVEGEEAGRVVRKPYFVIVSQAGGELLTATSTMPDAMRSDFIEFEIDGNVEAATTQLKTD
ncbi:MAG: hypothetical protein AAGL24_12760 [Pseudomonadota bacterium]